MIHRPLDHPTPHLKVITHIGGAQKVTVWKEHSQRRVSKVTLYTNLLNNLTFAFFPSFLLQAI